MEHFLAMSCMNCRSVRKTLNSPPLQMNNNQKGGIANHCNLDVLSDMLFISKQAIINHSKSFQLWREGLKSGMPLI